MRRPAPPSISQSISQSKQALSAFAPAGIRAAVCNVCGGVQGSYKYDADVAEMRKVISAMKAATMQSMTSEKLAAMEKCKCNE